MTIERTPEEQEEFDRMRIYFEFEARRGYLRVQSELIERLPEPVLQERQAELKRQWIELEKEYALVEIKRLEKFLAAHP